MTTLVLPTDELSGLPARQTSGSPLEDSSVVEQFIESSRGMVPGLQVSLAKRVVMPGSKKVFCMAAHTTVPLNDDELSSVSQLALRLSDGTSCLLSVQFYNDTTSSEYTSPAYTSFVYDPERYNTVQGRSNLGIFLVATALCGLVCFYRIAAGNFTANHRQWKSGAGYTPPVASPVLARSVFKPVNATMAKTSQATEFRSPVKVSPRPGAVAAGARTRSRLGQPVLTKAFQLQHPANGSMLVPPPPPMVYSWSSPRQFSQSVEQAHIEQVQIPFPANSEAKLITKGGRTAEVALRQMAPPATTVRSQLGSRDLVEPTADHHSAVRQPASPTERISATQNYEGGSAPIPGSEPSMPLERITAPAQ